jgi:hypothetical protein
MWFSRLMGLLFSSDNANYPSSRNHLSNGPALTWTDVIQFKGQAHSQRESFAFRKGFAPKQVKDGCYGLLGIRERARMLGGVFAFRARRTKAPDSESNSPLLKKEDSESHRDK